MKTGVIEMSMSQYLSEHGVSQSMLKLIDKSPAHLRQNLDHPRPSTPDQILGTIFDMAVFDPGNLESSCHVKPAEYVNAKGERLKWSGNSNVCKEWVFDHQDKPIISQEDFDAVKAMRASVFSHPAAALALKEGRTGRSLFCEDAETGLQLRGRPDWMSGNVIVDLKSCQDASPDGFARAVAAFSYEIQAAFYLDICAVLSLSKEHFLFIACEKAAPHCTAVYELDEESISIGREKYRRLLARYLQCVVDDKWPGYSRHIERLSLPQWSKRQAESAALLESQPIQPALEIA